MNKQVLKGFNYVATSASGTTITDSNGIVLCEVEAGKQGYFVATTSVIDCGTEDVSIVEIRGNFNVPSTGGGGGVDPTPYIEEIERLEGEIEVLEGQILQLQGEIAELEEDVQSKAAQITALNEQIATLQAQIAALQARIAELEAALSPNSMLYVGDAGSVQPFFSKFTNGIIKFQNLPSGTVWSYPLEGLTNATNMFRECYELTSFTAALPNTLTNAYGMFYYCRNLTSWTVALPNSLTSTSQMFGNCTGLTSWNVELPNSITNASGMFYYCTGLTSWNVELPNSITNVSDMFVGCSNLTSFSTPSGALPNTITNGNTMFSHCTKLTSFSTAMPSGLNNAQMMFHECKLDKASVQNIVDTIPTLRSSRNITIGVDSTEITQEEQDAFNTTIVGKKWRVTWQRN